MDVRQKIHDHLSGCYRQTLEQIAKAIDLPEVEVKKALDEMITSGTVYTVADGAYRCNLGNPIWMDDVLEALIYESGVTGFQWAVVPEDGQLIIYPAPFRVEGSDETCWEPFRIDLDDVLALFDKRPHIAFSQDDGATELDLEGEIDKQHAWITIQDRPDADEEPVGIMHKDGRFSQYGD
jgi:hypothetical protein